MKRSFLCVSALVVGLIAACSSTDSSSPRPNSGEEIVLSERVNVITAAQADQARVEADRLIFPAMGNAALLDLAAGAILAGDRSNPISADNPSGFLREVVKVYAEGDSIVVETLQASLSDAIVSGTVSAQFDGVGGEELAVPSARAPVWSGPGRRAPRPAAPTAGGAGRCTRPLR